MRTVTIYKADFKGGWSEQQDIFNVLLRDFGLISYDAGRHGNPQFTDLGAEKYPDVEDAEHIDVLEFRVDSNDVVEQ